MRIVRFAVVCLIEVVNMRHRLLKVGRTQQNITLLQKDFLGPWELEGKSEVFCYECHEILLHNPVFTPENIVSFAELVSLNKLDEQIKTDSVDKLAKRVELLQKVIEHGIRKLKNESGCPTRI